MYKKIFQMLTFSMCIYMITECKAENLCPKDMSSCQCLQLRDNKWHCYSNTGFQIWPVSTMTFSSHEECQKVCPLRNY